MSQKPIVIVGASVAGVRTAQALRGRGYAGRLVVLENEDQLPYDKPPLTKAMLDAAESPDPVRLVTDEQLAALELDLRLGTGATSLDVASSSIMCTDDQVLEFASLVIACGLQPRTLPGANRLDGVHTIRSADDATALRRELETAGSVVVVGAGFIGAEFAAAARARGIAVAIVEVQAEPMAHLLGAEVGRMIVKLHEENGVDVHTGVSVARFLGEGTVEAVELSNGHVLPADIVVIGIGARPATGWLESSSLPLEDGVRCDAGLRVIGTRNVFAAGDVARWPHAFYGQELRIEHWTNANEHASLVGASILGLPAPTTPIPYVWSDQYGKRIQILGRPSIGTVATTAGDASAGPFSAVYVDEQDVLVGALVIDDPRTMLSLRRAIMNRLAAHELL